MERSAAYATAVVVLHHVILSLHTAAHNELGIIPPPPQLAFVVAVIVIAPVAALALMLGHRGVVGAPLLAGSMAASLVFGVVSHVFIPGADNFSGIPAGLSGSLFEASGILLAVLEAMGALVGGWAWLRLRGPRSTPLPE